MQLLAASRFAPTEYARTPAGSRVPGALECRDRQSRSTAWCGSEKTPDRSNAALTAQWQKSARGSHTRAASFYALSVVRSGSLVVVESFRFNCTGLVCWPGALQKAKGPLE